MGLLRQLLPLRGPLKKVPRNRPGDFKARLARGIYLDLHNASDMIGILLDEFGGESEFAQATNGFRSEVVAPQAACGNPFIPKQRGDVGEVGGRSSQLLAGGKQIPKQFAETDDDVFVRHEAPEVRGSCG